VVEGAGHLIQLERPEAVLDAIVDVLRTVQRAAASRTMLFPIPGDMRLSTNHNP
jgi:hypothetical protein